MTSKDGQLNFPKLTSWTRRLTFECEKECFEVCIVYLQSINLTSLQLEILASQLPREELSRLSDKAVFSRRRDYILGRHAARMAIHAALGTQLLNYVDNLSAVLILPGVFTQPVLSTEGSASRLGVSISHHDGCAVAITFDRRHPMALDLEPIALEQQVIFEELTDFRERESIKTELSSFSEIERLCLLWTCKEALGKVMGCGLTVPPEFLTVASANPSLSIALPEGRVPTWQGTYRNCPQFTWYAWKLSNSWLTFVAPAQSHLISCRDPHKKTITLMATDLK